MSVLGPFLPYIVGGLAAIIGGGWFVHRQRKAGREAERAAQRRKTDEVKERQEEAAARAPRDRDGVSRKLRDSQF